MKNETLLARRLNWAKALLPLLCLALAGAAQTGAYQSVPPSPDGIGKAYMGREIAQVMGWQGAAWLEREEREKEERGDLLLRELALKPGQDVADIGAGTGYYSRRMAPLVAPRGTVYAVDGVPPANLHESNRSP
jgi:hypothetical protein